MRKHTSDKDSTWDEESVLKISPESNRLLRYDLLSEVTGEGVWDYDVLTNLSEYNEGMKKLFGYSNKEMSNNKSWWESNIHPEDRERVVGAMKDLLASDRNSWYGEYLFRKKSGEYISVLERLIVLRNSNGNPVRILGTMQDLSTINNLNTAIEKERKETRRKIIQTFLSAEEREKKELSDELHENINQVLATIHLLQSDQDSPRQSLNPDQQKMRRLLHNMMNVVSSIANKLSPLGADLLSFDDLIAVAVNGLFEHSDILVHQKIQVKGIQWSNYEKNFVYRIIVEQLKNVIKHSHASHCTIRVAKQKNEYLIEIIDDGEGADLDSLVYGNGFSKIHYITEALNGQYLIKTAPGKGFALELRFVGSE